MTRAPTIGIIAGSGPDAGIDLWQKILAHARAGADRDYGGDADAPRVEVISEPRLGASMDLPDTDAQVWAALEETARAITDRCDVYGIACNTLNVYAPRLDTLGLGAELITLPEAVRSWAASTGVAAVGLMGARPVATLSEWSPYASLSEDLTVETPPDVDGLHSLITEIKTHGGVHPRLRERFAELAAAFEAPHLLLACTELPLVTVRVDGKELVDPTDLLAGALVRRWSELAAG